MRDPFRPNSKSQLVREAQVGLSVVAILLSLFLYLAFYRITGRGRQIPEHIRNAPIAKSSSTLGSSHAELKSLLQKIAEKREATSSKLGRLPAVDSPLDLGLSSIESAVGNRDPSFQASAESYNQLASANAAVEPELNREPAPLRTKDSSQRRSKTSIAGQLSSFLSGYGSQAKPSGSLVKESVAMTATPGPQSQGEFSPIKSTQASLPNAIRDRKIYGGSAPRMPISTDGGENQSIQNAPAIRTPSVPPLELTGAETRSQSAFESNSQRRQTDLASTDQPSFDSQSRSNQGGNLESHLDKLPNIRLPKPDLYAPTSVAQRIPRFAPGDYRPKQVKLNSVPESRIEAVAGIPPEDQIEPAREVTTNETQPSHAANYVVQVDESLYTVAQSVYQDGKYFRALYKQNEELIEQAQGQLTGLSLDTPTRRELRRRWPGTVPAKEASISGEERSAAHESMQQFYTTEAGDTLFDISGRKLNQASRYLEIYKMNQLRLDAQTDPYSELPAGIKLILPPL